MRIALCDYDEKYLASLFTYLYGKCEGKAFSSFSVVDDYIDALSSNKYDYVIMSDDFYEAATMDEKCNIGATTNIDKLIILSTSVDDINSTDAEVRIYKYGPMDGLCRMIGSSAKHSDHGRSLAIYSPAHHELLEMYGLSLCETLSSAGKVLLIDMVNCPIIRRLIRDGPNGSVVDMIYMLENGKTDELKGLIGEYNAVDVLPLAQSPTDIASISRKQWGKLLTLISSLDYEECVFILEDVNSGFGEIMSYVDGCILVNKQGDYYKDVQTNMREAIETLGAEAIPIELNMSANNLTEGCYQLEELLTGSLSRFAKATLQAIG